MRRVSSKRLWLELQRLADDRAPLQIEGVSDRALSDDPTRLGMPGAFRLDGAPGHPGLGENSFAGHTPLLTLALHDTEWQLLLSARRMVAMEPFDGADPFGPLRRVAAILHRPGDPPFAGAMTGYVTYELGERLLEVSPRPLDHPHALFFVHDRLARRGTDGWEIVCTGVDRRRRALDLRSWSEGLPALTEAPPDPVAARVVDDSLGPDAHRRALEEIQRYIGSGHVYQANLTRMLTLAIDGSPHAYYRALRARHPAPFAAYLVEPRGAVVLGISPELFLRVDGTRAETRPIKGTRPRGHTPDDDRRLRDELWESEKDAAELVMIVDLMRNDLGRVAAFGSVQVPETKRLDAHPTLYHLSGVVEARLDPRRTAWDLLAASLPAGSITGAPKRRAVEILRELEPHSRGVYTGAVGMIDFAGNMVLNVAIRTVRMIGDRGWLGVGGGIVADSDADAEFEESNDKARAFLLEPR